MKDVFIGNARTVGTQETNNINPSLQRRQVSSTIFAMYSEIIGANKVWWISYLHHFLGPSASSSGCWGAWIYAPIFWLSCAGLLFKARNLCPVTDQLCDVDICVIVESAFIHNLNTWLRPNNPMSCLIKTLDCWVPRGKNGRGDI